MTKYRRKQLAKAVELLQEAQQIIEEVKDEEQEAFDNLPEPLQYSERGEAMEEAISELEEVCDSMDGIISSVEAAGE